MKKTLTLLCSLMMCLCLLFGCAPPETPTGTLAITPSATPENTATLTPTQGPITATDLAGREITLNSQPQKVVSLVPSVTELLYALGAQDMLCGRDSYSTYPQEAAELPIMGDYNGPNVELIVAAQPDVVFTAGALQAEAETQLTNAGITVITAEATTLDDIKLSIQLLGAVCGKGDQATALCAQADDYITQIKALAAGMDCTAYYIVSCGEYGEYSVGPGSFIYDILTMGGVTLITKDMEYAYPQFSIEAIVSSNPSVIIADSYAATLETLQGMPGYKDLDTVKNGRVLFVDSDKASRPTVRFFEEMLACLKAIQEL